MVKNVCSERKTIIPKPIIRLTSFDLIQTTIFLPRAKDYLTTIVRSWHTCNQRSATLRQISYRSALPFTRGCGRITGRSEVGDPDFEISWTWHETMVSVWTVCRTEMGVKVTSGVNSFLWPSIKECETWSMSVCLDKPTHDDSREQRSDFFLFPFFLSLKWRRSSNLGTVSEISFHPPLFLQYP